MKTINDRISMVVADSNKTKTEFARSINISQPFLSQICSGTKIPSERTICDICRVHGVNESWLRTGEGEMLKPVNRDTEIASFMGDIMRGEDADFRRRLISVLARLDSSEWELLEKMALMLAAESKKEDQA